MLDGACVASILVGSSACRAQSVSPSRAAVLQVRVMGKKSRADSAGTVNFFFFFLRVILMCVEYVSSVVGSNRRMWYDLRSFEKKSFFKCRDSLFF